MDAGLGGRLRLARLLTHAPESQPSWHASTRNVRGVVFDLNPVDLRQRERVVGERPGKGRRKTSAGVRVMHPIADLKAAWTDALVQPGAADHVTARNAPTSSSPPAAASSFHRAIIARRSSISFGSSMTHAINGRRCGRFSAIATLSASASATRHDRINNGPRAISIDIARG
jgi:hypothetical protein